MYTSAIPDRPSGLGDGLDADDDDDNNEDGEDVDLFLSSINLASESRDNDSALRPLVPYMTSLMAPPDLNGVTVSRAPRPPPARPLAHRHTHPRAPHRTMGQDVFVAAYSMYLQANTMITHPLVPHGTQNEVLE